MMERHYIEFATPENADLVQDNVAAPGDDEVIISVHHAGINRADLLQRLGLYPPPADASPIPGLEVSGVVAAIGKNITAYAIGDRVCALTHGGGYASVAIARGDHCLPLPDAMTTEQGAALPEALLTVWYNVFERGRLTAGETVLIHGGSSGIGSIGIQMARAMGATVLSTAGSEARCAAVAKLGANFDPNHREGDLLEQFKEAGYAGKIDVILDIAGGDLTQTNLDLAAQDGRIVCIGVMRGMQSEINLATVFMKRLTLTGSTLRRLETDTRAQCFQSIRTQLWPAVIAGEIAPIVEASYPLQDVLEAHQHMQSGGHFGKLLLDCRLA
jgi:NADPH2:quinone reductase